jgi:hypothetical protein
MKNRDVPVNSITTHHRPSTTKLITCNASEQNEECGREVRGAFEKRIPRVIDMKFLSRVIVRHGADVIDQGVLACILLTSFS